MVRIELAGEPKGKGRPRFVRATGAAYTPKPTRDYESALRLAAQAAMAGAPPLDGPLTISLRAEFSVPRSWPKKKQAAALAGDIQPTGRPDLDNLVKMLDALNTIVWRDDSQIVSGTIMKAYSDRPRLLVTVGKED